MIATILAVVGWVVALLFALAFRGARLPRDKFACPICHGTDITFATEIKFTPGDTHETRLKVSCPCGMEGDFGPSGREPNKRKPGMECNRDGQCPTCGNEACERGLWLSADPCPDWRPRDAR